MPLETGVWRIDGDRPRRLTGGTLDNEAQLEQFLESDPRLLGDRLLIIGRQVRTDHGKFIDLLAIDGDGVVNVLELKRDRTPRDVIAQALDYGSWVKDLDRDRILEIANNYFLDQSFEAAFADAFGTPPPDELNVEHRLTIVASELDSSSERIVNYLGDLGVPINVVFFNVLVDEDRRYLARSWLISPDEAQATVTRKGRPGKRAEWNGRDWFVSFGEGQGRSWQDGLRYNFVSAGGGRWFSRTLQSLPEGARIFVNIPQTGFVAVGETTGSATAFADAVIEFEGRRVRLAEQSLNAAYEHPANQDDDTDEYVVPVRWLEAQPRESAYWEKGMFANQNSACKLRQQFTIDKLYAHFGLDEE